MSPKKKLDKRLYAPRIIGIILFASSIFLFLTSSIAGLMNIFIQHNTSQVIEHENFFPQFYYWIFEYYSLVAFSQAAFCIPLFFAGRALYQFKEWGRIFSIIMLFILLIILIAMTVLMAVMKYDPFFFAFFKFAMVLSFVIYVAHPAFALYFLMRRRTREGIKEYNENKKNILKEIPQPQYTRRNNFQYDLAKGIVASVKNMPLPKRKKSPALITAGLMMIILPAIWTLVSFIVMLSSHGIFILVGLINLCTSIFCIFMGVRVVDHQIRFRMWAIIACAANLVMTILILIGPVYPIMIFFGSYYIAVVLLLVFNYRKFFDEIWDDDEILESTPNPAEIELQELQKLIEVKNVGEITEQEFDEKSFEIKIKYRSQSLLNSLLKRKNNNTLSEEEYQEQCEKVIIEKKNEVIHELKLEKEKQVLFMQRFEKIPANRIEKLSQTNQAKLKKFIHLMEPSDIIVFHDTTIKLIHAERWVAINEANRQDEFEIILQL